MELWKNRHIRKVIADWNFAIPVWTISFHWFYLLRITKCNIIAPFKSLRENYRVSVAHLTVFETSSPPHHHPHILPMLRGCQAICLASFLVLLSLFDAGKLSSFENRFLLFLCFASWSWKYGWMDEQIFFHPPPRSFGHSWNIDKHTYLTRWSTNKEKGREEVKLFWELLDSFVGLLWFLKNWFDWYLPTFWWYI